MPLSMKRYTVFLLLFFLLFLGCSNEEEEQVMVGVFQQYQAALSEEDPGKILNCIDSNSRQYLLAQLELLRREDRKAVQEYVTKSPHPVLNVEMIARALNYYQPEQIDTISFDNFLHFDLGYWIELEKPVMEGYTFRKKLLVNDRKGILKFARLMADGRYMVADMEFLKENGTWKLNLMERLDVQEINARTILKTMDRNIWKYVAETLDKYY